MIGNLLPYLFHHHGEITKNCFTPSAVDRLSDCKWDPETNSIIGTYDDEINFLDDSDIMAKYISSKTPNTPTVSNLQPPPHLPHSPPNKLSTTAYGNDEDSVSTLGNHTTKKWTAAYPTSTSNQQYVIPNTIAPSPKPSSHSDDRSQGSISTLNTRLNSIEGQYQELSGTMEHIKQMLDILANPKTPRDEDPKSPATASQGNLAGDPS